MFIRENKVIAIAANTADYDIFQDAGFKNALMRHTDAADLAEVDAMIDAGLHDFEFTIIMGAANKLSFNNESYDDHVTNIGFAYSSGLILDRVTSLRLQSTGSGTFEFNIITTQ